MDFASLPRRGEFFVDELIAIEPRQQNLDEFCSYLVETWAGIAQAV
jgi:hypothetical protein